VDTTKPKVDVAYGHVTILVFRGNLYNFLTVDFRKFKYYGSYPELYFDHDHYVGVCCAWPMVALPHYYFGGNLLFVCNSIIFAVIKPEILM